MTGSVDFVPSIITLNCNATGRYVIIKKLADGPWEINEFDCVLERGRFQLILCIDLIDIDNIKKAIIVFPFCKFI